MNAALTVAPRPLGRAGCAAARYRTSRYEIEPLGAPPVDVAALGSLRYRHSANARTRARSGGGR